MHFGISEGMGGLKYGSCLWLGMDIFWNCPMQRFVQSNSHVSRLSKHGKKSAVHCSSKMVVRNSLLLSRATNAPTQVSLCSHWGPTTCAGMGGPVLNINGAITKK